MLEFLIQNIAPLFIGLLTFKVMGGFKWAADFIDKKSPAFQRILVGLIAVGLTLAGSAANVALPTDLTLITADNLEALFAALIAMGVHFIDKRAAA